MREAFDSFSQSLDEALNITIYVEEYIKKKSRPPEIAVQRLNALAKVKESLKNDTKKRVQKKNLLDSTQDLEESHYSKFPAFGLTYSKGVNLKKSKKAMQDEEISFSKNSAGHIQIFNKRPPDK